MASMRVIGRDLDCDIYAGGAVDGSPSYGAAIAIEGRIRELRTSDEVGEIDTSALGDAAKRFRPDQSEWEIEADMVVEVGGLPAIVLGNYVKLVTKAYSTFGAATYEGFLKKITLTSRMGDVCMQSITVRGPADMTVA